MFKRILVAIDASTPAKRALEAAVELAAELGAQIALLHVVDPTPALVSEIGYMNQEHLAKLRTQGEALLARTFRSLPPSIPAERVIAEGDPAELILQTAHERSADLIVLGCDSRGRLAHFLLGSTADSVIRKADCPVMSVRADVASRNAKGLLVGMTG